jgi:hypothetical protein
LDLPTRFPNGHLDTNGGYYVDGTAIIDGSGNINAVAALFSSTLGITGLTTFNGPSLVSYTSATSTSATAMTLNQADLMYSSRLVTPNVGALTYTFPATSTLTTFIPTAGDMARQCFYNATSTAAATIIFAAGTGIDLEVATSSANTGGAFDLTLGAGNMGCFDFMRKTNTDIVAGFLEYSDAD